MTYRKNARYIVLLLLLCGDVETNPGPVSVPCPRCAQTFNRQSRLNNHLAQQEFLSCQHCTRNFCTTTRLRQHERTEHSGSGIANDVPAQPPADMTIPILGTTGYENQVGYLEKMNEHESVIQTQTKNRPDWKKSNIQIQPDFSYADLRSILNDVMTGEEGKAFKINLGFGCMLYHKTDHVFRYFYVSTNHFLFNRAYTISTQTDMTDFFNKIVGLDIANRYYMLRPSSGWVLAGLPNIETRIYRFHNIPIGAGTILPPHIKKSKSIIGLTHSAGNKTRPYDDNFCLFRCLALCFEANVRTLERIALSYKDKLEEVTGKTYDDGVGLDDLEEVEDMFKVRINVYSLQEGKDKAAEVVRISEKEHEKVMHLNLYDSHFSYITKFKSYAKKYQCPNCSRFIGNSANLTKHIRRCQVEVEEIYVGGKFKIKPTVFEALDKLNINVPKEDRYDTLFSVFDFEAMAVKTPKGTVEQGKTMHATHVPATVSICSNLTDHTEPVHIQTNGDPQELSDRFVDVLLTHHEAGKKIKTTKYEPALSELTERITQLKEILGIDEEEKEEEKEEEEEVMEHDGDLDNDMDEEEMIATGSKRKGKRKKDKNSKRRFLDSTAAVDDGSEGEDEEDFSDSEESDIEGLINDDEEEEENDANFYRLFDNNCMVQEEQQEEGEEEEEQEDELTPNERKFAEKTLKKYENALKRLLKYIRQHTVLGFNSQKYDIPLIRPYLASSLMKKEENDPEQVIKKTNGYMSLATPKLKFLDITNYLAAGTSLDKFYKAFEVSTPKGCFPYEWFDSLDKFNYTGLPPQSVFYSTLDKKTRNMYEYMNCWKTWNEQGMKTFADFIRYYNNADVIGFVEAVNKMLKNNMDRGLDMFKISVSLPGLTQRYIFNNLKDDDYFVGFGKEHKNYAKELRDSILGGPSIIFHRWHECLKTKIKGIVDNLCRCVLGFDANALYLYCIGKKMPTGWYTIQSEVDGYKKQEKYSRQSIQWLEYMMRTNDIHIRHAENGGEHRINNFSVDGFDEDNNTVYEFHGCFWHGHSCGTNYDEEKWNRTLEREQAIRDAGYNLVSITSCEWIQNPESKQLYPEPPPTPSQISEDEIQTKMNEILDDIKNDKVFGFAKVDIHVHEDDIPKFSEFPPIFKNTEITIDDIGEHMQEYCESIGRKTGVKRSLISSMKGKEMIILTPLLKWYLDNGLVVTRLHYFISYNGKECFNWFTKEVTNDRRAADLGGADLIMKGELSKLMGNSSYGYTLMNKTNHTQTSFIKRKNLQKHIRNPFLKNSDELEGDIFEVEKGKRKIVHDLPIQIGLAVYSYAKLRMLEFWKFINTYLDNDLYQFMEMDTDSLYIAFARDTIDECVKKDLQEEWKKEKYKWFASEDEKCTFNFRGERITFKQYDKRTPGKFKLEFEGEGMGCLNSKVYIVWGEKIKCSCKGTQQKRNQLGKDIFEKVLETKESHKVENAGFIRFKDGVIKTYTQVKTGMSYFYAKRKVLDDGVSTTHLDI